MDEWGALTLASYHGLWREVSPLGSSRLGRARAAGVSLRHSHSPVTPPTPPSITAACDAVTCRSMSSTTRTDYPTHTAKRVSCGTHL